MKLRALAVPAFLAVFAYGCASAGLNGSNVMWARDNNLPIVEINVPRGSWEDVKKFLYSYRGDPNVIIVVNMPLEHWGKTLEMFEVRKYNPGLIWDPGSTQFLEVRNYPCFFTPPNKIYRMGNYPCLDHEVGHVREYLEGVPYHSKYSH